MPLVHVDGTGQFSIVFSVAGTEGNSVVTCGFGTDDTDEQAIADRIADTAQLTWARLLSSRCLMTEVKVLLRTGGETVSSSSFLNMPFPGVSPADLLPSNCAVLVQKRTALAGRKHRGRLYIPGICANSYTLSGDQNTMETASHTELQTAFDLWFTSLTEGSGVPIILPAILHPSPTNTVTLIESFSVQARLATQRGRLRD